MDETIAPSWFDVPAIAGGLETVVIRTLKEPEVRDEIRAAVRPAVIEAAAIMGATLAAALAIYWIVK